MRSELHRHPLCTAGMEDTAAPAAAAPPRKPLTGPAYRAFIWDILKRKSARNYLEIGVRDGGTIVNAECPSIGVDPNFAFRVNPVGKKRALHLYQMTSDEFFRDYDPKAILGGTVDMAFLDGLHQFEYLLRDFINTERCCSRDSVILLDDCLPRNIEMTERIHREEARADVEVAKWWTGDVWKVVSILRRFRPELRITPVDVQPTGSIVVSNLNPESTLLYERYFEIVDEYADLELTQAVFDAYWEENAPVKVEQVLNGFDFTLFMRP
jgi:hypothetical protein